MTSAPVTNAFLTNAATKSNNKSKTNQESDSFTEVMAKTADYSSNKSQTYLASNSTKTETKAAEPDTKVKDTYNSGKSEKTDTTEKPDGSDNSQNNVEDKVEDAVNEEAQEITKEIADTLDVSEDEVKAAMESLGLTMADLLNPDNMTALTLEITGETDVTALLTNEALYNDVKDLIQMVTELTKNLMENLEITNEQLTDALNSMKQEAVTESTADNQIQAAVSGLDTDVIQTARVEIIKVETDGTKETIDTSKDGAGTADTATTIEKPIEAVDKQQASGESNHSMEEGSENNHSMMRDFQNNQTISLENVSEELSLTQSNVDTEDIINQITDYMKVQYKADETQMELQLHPASLGTINIQLTAKEGVVSAQIVAQSEAVKSAIEGQMVQLKDSLSEQGIKIEAVEVTVASHKFDSNLQQQTSQDGGQYEESSKSGRSSRRHINLNDLDGLEDGNLNEAEQIAVDMMEKNGNTVDYTA